MSTDIQTLSYEDAVDELNRILEKLEKKDCALLDMLTLTRRGLELVDYCEKILDSYEGSIRKCIPEDEPNVQ